MSTQEEPGKQASPTTWRRGISLGLLESTSKDSVGLWGKLSWEGQQAYYPTCTMQILKH